MIVHTLLESSNLAGNLLGDPSERDLFVYLPSGYEESDRRYPTAYLLQAYGTTAAEMMTPATDGERWRPPLEDVLDRVFGRMGVPPMIVLIPRRLVALGLQPQRSECSAGQPVLVREVSARRSFVVARGWLAPEAANACEIMPRLERCPCPLTLRLHYGRRQHDYQADPNLGLIADRVSLRTTVDSRVGLERAGRRARPAPRNRCVWLASLRMGSAVRRERVLVA